MSKTVAVAMSGGVDSSVTAAVLKGQGYRVIGVGLSLVDEAEPGGRTRSCCGLRDMDDARRVAERIDIPFYVLNFRDRFREHVIDYFVSSYLAGETPNPCVPCNSIIKFDHLLRAAMEFGAALLATGHYAVVEFDEDRKRSVLRRGADGAKDQSYFLYSLTQRQMALALFPMGRLRKTETRGIARELGLRVHDKPESQDICFVGPGGYAHYISERAGGGAGPGPILDGDGRELGRHRGLHHYTVGQRRGLGISSGEAMYVADIDPRANSITVRPATRARRQERVLLEGMNYVSVGRPGEPLAVEAAARYRKPAVGATLVPIDDARALVEFHEPREPTAPGQSVVMYSGDEVLCGGVARREPGG